MRNMRKMRNIPLYNALLYNLRSEKYYPGICSLKEYTILASESVIDSSNLPLTR